jgi:hypothetical protein
MESKYCVSSQTLGPLRVRWTHFSPAHLISLRYATILSSIYFLVSQDAAFHQISWTILLLLFVVHIDGAMLCIRTSATNRPVVYPLCDVCVWRATVEWYWQGKTEELGENLVPVPLCPQIPRGPNRARMTNIDTGLNSRLRHTRYCMTMRRLVCSYRHSQCAESKYQGFVSLHSMTPRASSERRNVRRH